MIERALVYFVTRGVEEAKAAGADLIVIDMNTPGGRLDATKEITDLLTGLEIETITFVNSDAISGGAITALATDRIFMSPAGRIGDAMPIMMSPLPFSGPQELPDGLKEKMVSPTVALIRSVAQRKGHDERLAETMVRPELEYKIGDRVICPAGQLLTLTSRDAEQLVGEGEGRRRLLSSGTVTDLEDLLRTIGREGDRVVTVAPTAGERIGRIVEGFPVSGLLLALGLLCLYIEFKTPGFGFPGIAGILLLAVWFWGHHVAGLANAAEILLFVFGVVLLVVELLAIPGFGIVGATGLAFMAAALLMAMVEHYPSAPWYSPPRYDIEKAIINFGFAMVATFVGGALLGRFLPKTSLFRSLALNTAVSRDAGYEAAPETPELTGMQGVAVTPLHPAGLADIGDRRVNVVARGAFIDKGLPVVVKEVHGNRVVVEEAKQG
jgi:membrane-bound serine protease (ClpP class)